MRVDALNIFRETLSLVFRIDGAVAMKEAEILERKNPEDDYIKLPEMNSDYKYALIKKDDVLLYASKDGENYSVAVEVKLTAGAVLSYQEIYESLFE